MNKAKKPYWETRELVIIGTFTALIKVSSFLVSITGGGMTPLSMIMKNVVATSLLIILVMNVRKFGVIALYALISSLITMITMGSGLMLMPGLLIGGILCDIIVACFGGYKSPFAVIAGVALFDILYRGVALGLGYVMARENSGMFVMAAFVVVLGYLGCLIGLFSGYVFSKELKHAGIIKE